MCSKRMIFIQVLSIPAPNGMTIECPIFYITKSNEKPVFFQCVQTYNLYLSIKSIFAQLFTGVNSCAQVLPNDLFVTLV